MGAVIVALAGAFMVLYGPDRVGSELVVVLPGPNGKVGTVVVQRGSVRTVLNQAYAASRIVDGGQPLAQSLGEGAVRQEFDEALGALPGRPVAFVVFFLEGKDEFTVESRAEFDSILSQLRDRDGLEFVVIGHTDRLASDGFNDRLSVQRAIRVQEELVRLGIPPARIQAAGRGEREPLVHTPDGVAEPRNRRVEINVR